MLCSVIFIFIFFSLFHEMFLLPLLVLIFRNRPGQQVAVQVGAHLGDLSLVVEPHDPAVRLVVFETCGDSDVGILWFWGGI